MAGAAVSVEGLSKAYRARSRWGGRRGPTRWALRDVDLEVAPGRTVGVIGSNGSGKTTLLQVLAGVLVPTSGQVRTQGRVASLVDLTAGFHRDLTGHENLMVGGVLLGVGRRELARRYDDIVAFSGLETDALDRPLAGYSAGMGLRLGFALVVATEPDVLLVDEVLAVGDEAFQQRGLARIDELRRAGTAVVLVSHDMALVQARCDEVAVLDAGRVVDVGEPAATVAGYVAAAERAAADAAAAGAVVPERLFEPSWRAGQARRRRGVR
jgi:ABC-type polysaccharide/polyol phosphate transport system ATPase subunit